MVNTNTLSDYKYVIPASGSLTINQYLNNVKMFPVNDLSYVDVSGSLQLNVDVGLFAINKSIDHATGNFINDYITITAQEIMQYLIGVQSVGYLENIYTNYNNYVNAYFGNTSGFSVKFTTDMSGVGGKYNNGFTNNTLDSTHAVLLLEEMKGSITINGLTELLRYVCLEDPFKNRPVYELYEYTNGFVENDLIYFKSGINITLNTQIDNSGILIYSQNISSFQTIDDFHNKYAIIDSSGNYLETVTNTDLAATELITASSPAPANVGGVGGPSTYIFNSSPPVYNNSILTMSVNIPLLLILHKPVITQTASLIRYFPFDTDFNDYSTGSANTSNALVLQGNTVEPTTSYFTISNTNSVVGNGSLQLNFLNTSPDLTTANLHTPISRYNTNGHSISFWFYSATDDTTTFYSNGSLIRLTSDQNPTGGGNYVYDISILNRTLRLNYGISGDNYLTGYIGIGWFHFAITITTNGILQIYINGCNTRCGNTLQYTAPCPYYSQINGLSVFSGGTGNGNINIDDLYYFDGILTDTEMLNLYNSSVKTTTTVLEKFYPFYNNFNDYADGSSIADLTMVTPTGGSVNNYVVAGAGAGVSIFNYPKYLNGNGFQCSAIMNTSTTYNYGNPPTQLNSYPLTICTQNNNGYTFSFWTTGGSEQNGNPGGTLFQVNSSNTYPSFNMLYSVEQLANSSNLSINYASNNNSVSNCQVNFSNYSNLSWYHVVITITTSNVMNIYVNSVLASTTTMPYNSNVSGIQFYTGFNTYSNSQPCMNKLIQFYYIDGILNNNQIRLLYNMVAGENGRLPSTQGNLTSNSGFYDFTYNTGFRIQT
jgi:hypothetical protein